MATGTLPDSDQDKIIDKNESDELFNRVYGNDNAKGLDDAEKAANAPQDANASLGDKESNPGPAGFINNVTGSKGGKGKGRFNLFKTVAKKRGATALIVLLLGGGGIGFGSIIAGPSLLFEQLSAVLKNSLNSADPAVSVHSMRLMSNKVKNSFAMSDETGSCGIKCKLGSMNDTMKRNLEARGFTVDGDKNKLGRYSVRSITFPDGTVASNGKEFTDALSNTSRAAAFNKVFNSRAAYLLNSKFGSVLKAKFGLDKLSHLAGNTKAKVIASMRKALGLQGDSAADDPLRGQTPEERVQDDPRVADINKKISVAKEGLGKVSNYVGGACLGYDAAKLISYSDKAVKIAAFASFAMLFLNAADQIRAGDADPTVISTLGDQLTQTQTNKTILNSDGTPSTTPNDYYGQSATDSLGYRSAAYNDTGTLTDQDKKYAAAPLGALAVLSTILGYINPAGKAGVGVQGVIHTTCKLIGSEAATAASCIPEGLAGSVVPVVGNALAFLGCNLTQAAIGKGVGLVITNLLPGVVKDIIAYDLPVLDETTIGAAAGNAIYSGTAEIYGGTAASYGLEAGTPTAIAQYAVDTAAINKYNDQVASYEAKSTPFDISNQYSFLGSLAIKLNLASFSSSSTGSLVSNIMNIIPTSVASISTNTYAAANTKATVYTNQCTDSSINNLGIGADAFCNPYYVMSNTALNMDPNTAVDYMIANNDIDATTGDAIAGSPYQQYLDNCANRTAPLGESNGSISDDNYAWETGINCTNGDPQLDYFSAYTMDNALNDTMDEGAGAATTTTVSSAQTGSVKTKTTTMLGKISTSIKDSPIIKGISGLFSTIPVNFKNELAI